jgi:hypothetical protein
MWSGCAWVVITKPMSGISMPKLVRPFLYMLKEIKMAGINKHAGRAINQICVTIIDG